MPEGHTIHRIASRHNAAFAGAPVEVSSPQGRFGAGASRLDGRTLEGVEAFGKHLLYRWEGRLGLHVHLGLVGKFRTHPAPAPEPSAATRLALVNESASAYLTGPMVCKLVDGAAFDAIVGHLGPDPLRPGTRVTEFTSRVRGDPRPIGAVVLDQEMIAGIGNVYRSEVLFLCGIHPDTPAVDLSAEELGAVWREARTQLRRGVDDGRIVTVSPRDVGAARRADLPEPLRRYVYKRGHRPCLRCRTPIEMSEIAGRNMWWCPSCQQRR